ncbi:hypothetical protein cypCar_00035031, partial [Cyprinus carpio]
MGFCCSHCGDSLQTLLSLQFDKRQQQENQTGRVPPDSDATAASAVTPPAAAASQGKPSLRRIKGRIHRSKSLDSIDLLDCNAEGHLQSCVVVYVTDDLDQALFVHIRVRLFVRIFFPWDSDKQLHYFGPAIFEISLLWLPMLKEEMDGATEIFCIVA